MLQYILATYKRHILCLSTDTFRRSQAGLPGLPAPPNNLFVTRFPGALPYYSLWMLLLFLREKAEIARGAACVASICFNGAWRDGVSSWNCMIDCHYHYYLRGQVRPWLCWNLVLHLPSQRSLPLDWTTSVTCFLSCESEAQPTMELRHFFQILMFCIPLKVKWVEKGWLVKKILHSKVLLTF